MFMIALLADSVSSSGFEFRFPPHAHIYAGHLGGVRFFFLVGCLIRSYCCRASAFRRLQSPDSGRRFRLTVAAAQLCFIDQ